jgi:hypothetical protein
MSEPLKIDPAAAEPFPLCGTDCPQLGYNAARDQYFCKVTDEWLPGSDVVCVPFIQRKFAKLYEEIKGWKEVALGLKEAEGD